MPKLSKIIGIAVGLLVAATVLPMGLDMLADTSTETEVTYDIEENIGVGDGATLDYDGNFENTPLVEDDGVIVTAVIDGEENEFTEDDSEVSVSDWDDGSYDISFDTEVDDGETIYAEYTYDAGTEDWPDAVGTLLKVLLPVLAVIGITLFFFNKTN